VRVVCFVLKRLFSFLVKLCDVQFYKHNLLACFIKCIVLLQYMIG
jgi:hypothetical protein